MSYWRIIGMETHDAATNMAIDEAVAEAVAARDCAPTIRFYRWNPSAVSIGYFQSIFDEVNSGACAAAEIDIVRRRTGGGAVYHDFNGEITYSVIAPEALFPRGIIDSYKIICGWIIDALALLDIHAEFKPINDIVIGNTAFDEAGKSLAGKKVSGNAQTRRNGVLLQHGTVLFDVDVRKMFSFLKVGDEKISDKMIAAVEDRVIGINKMKPKLSIDDVYFAMLESFISGKHWDKGDLTIAELTRTQELIADRYSKKDWNEMR